MLLPVRTPMWRLVYQGADITGDIAPDAVSVTYTDHEHGKSDEIEVALEDRTGKWKEAWYPTKGDTIDLWVGYRLGPIMPCGTFRLDEPEFSGPPDQVSLRGLAASITDDLRTRRSRAYESQTLSGIAGAVAGEHGLSVVGEIADVSFERVTQDNETDLAFLRRLAADYGHSFTVRGGQLIFAQTDALRAADPVAALGRGDLISYSLRDKARETYRACEVSYQDPATKELITQTVYADGVESGDTLRRQVRVENADQAEARARALLDEQNRSELAGSLKVSGEPRLVAGINVSLVGLGRLSGTYHVVRSTHTVARAGGYTTAVEVERVS